MLFLIIPNDKRAVNPTGTASTISLSICAFFILFDNIDIVTDKKTEIRDNINKKIIINNMFIKIFSFCINLKSEGLVVNLNDIKYEPKLISKFKTDTIISEKAFPQ